VVRRLILLVAAVGVAAAAVVGLASASRSAPSISPSQEAAWPWEPSGSIPAGTSGNDWEHGLGDLARTQFSYLKQINTSNVSKLHVVWEQHLAPQGYTGPIQGTPIVVAGKGKNIPDEGGTMFVAANKGVVALNAASGKILWAYVGPNPKPKEGAAPAPQLQFGNTTKDFSYCAGEVITGQQDGSITALNAKTGAPLWTNQVSAVSEFVGHTGQTSPPTDCDPTGGPAHNGIIFGGPNGSSSPLRGHLDAIDLKTGQLIWRWFTTPDPTQLPFILTWGNPAEAALGGGGTWSGTSIDPGLHQVYSASGNAYAQLGRQPGKDLWTASVFSLDENTGQLDWYWQETHHDLWDMDHGNPVMIMNVKINGKLYPAFVGCDKHSYCEVLDRRNGHPLPPFPMKETAVADPSGTGLTLNSEYPTQLLPTCTPSGNSCAMAQLYTHNPTEEQAAESFPTYPVGPNGTPMKIEPPFAATTNTYYSIEALFGGGGINYNRDSYDPLTNNFYVCANNILTAAENLSPTDWHTTSLSSPITSVWVSAVNLSNNTLSWQDKFNGAINQNGQIVFPPNPGFPTAAWAGGCFGGIISTAGNLVFMDTRAPVSLFSGLAPGSVNGGGVLAAFDATTGKGPLWFWQAPDDINGSPMTYEADGKQYVALYHKLNPLDPASNGYGEMLTVFSL
jgi:quinohemoprotein ethanol dehydrogenase